MADAVYFVIILALAIVIAILFYLLVQKTLTLVPPSPCAGRYTATPATTGTTLIACGESGLTPCTFSQTSLAASVSNCNSQPVLCQAFAYSSVTQTQTFINASQPFIGGSTTDLYVRNT